MSFSARKVPLALLALAGLVPCAHATLLTFDNLAEDYYGYELTLDDITFCNPFDGDGVPLWSVDDGSSFFPLYPPLQQYIDGSFLSTHGMVQGPDGILLTIKKSFEIATAGLRNYASLNFMYIVEDGGGNFRENTITLDALRGDQLVYTTTVYSDDEVVNTGRSILGATHFIVDNVSFDRLRFTTAGPHNNGTVLGGIDNVLIVPEPAALLALLTGAALLRRR